MCLGRILCTKGFNHLKNELQSYLFFLALSLDCFFVIYYDSLLNLYFLPAFYLRNIHIFKTLLPDFVLNKL